MLPSLLKNVFIVLILFGLLYVVTLVSPTIKKQADTQMAKVLGATTSKAKETALPESLKEDAMEQASEVKDQAMKIRVEDIVHTVQRLEKIPKDIDLIKNSIEEQVEHLFKK